MHHNFKSFYLILVCLFSLAASAYGEKTSNILYINSYNVGYDWTDDVTEGIRSELSGYSNITLLVEFMDTKRFSDKDYYYLLSELYTYKYANKDIDLVLLSDDTAMEFYLEFGEKIFGDIPVVFCGIDDIDAYNIENKPMCGVLENIDFKGAFEIFSKLCPDAKRIQIFIGKSSTSAIYKKEFEEYAPYFKDAPFHLDLVVNDEFSIDSLGYLVEKIESPDIIFYPGILIDKYGQTTSFENALQQIVNNAKVPVFGGVRESNKHSIVGGLYGMGQYQGKLAVQIALKLLGYVQYESIPKIIEPKGTFLFNYSKMQDFGIDPDLLPENAILIDTPFNAFKEYRQTIIGFLALLTVLTLIIFLQRRNLSQKVRFENELIEARDKAQESDRLKSSFISNMSHEIRTPLNSIMGFCELIASNTPTKKLEKYKQYILLNGETLNRIINDILMLSRLESKQIQVKYSERNIDDYLEKLNEQFLRIQKMYYNDYDVVINFKPAKKSIMAVTDFPRMNQIITNLMTNALKFTKKGSITWQYSVSKQEICLYVEDTGSGIAPENQKIVFDRFVKFQTNDSFTQGIGLGLAITKELVNKLGGKIELSSELGKGTRFVVTLPNEKRRGTTPANSYL